MFDATILVDRAGALPDVDAQAFAALVTTRSAAPKPWVSVAPGRLEAQLHSAATNAAAAPVAAAVLARLLRLGEKLSFEATLELESLAYSTLLGSAEFRRWRATAKAGLNIPTVPEPVRYERADDDVTLVLASPGNHNAMTATMRDALFHGLSAVVDDPSRPRLVLRGEGKCFSTGGHLPEFGSAPDMAQAHVVRVLRSSAMLLHRLGDRAEARLHGACIGSGIEVPAAAAHRIAAPDTIIQLPELGMGLIPGAGGTVTLTRAIGRHRLFWLALGGFRVGASQALDWGLFHRVEP
ncbi:MAG: enoyl-CoA hydratase/isomerase family protein [Blastomonas sp.]